MTRKTFLRIALWCDVFVLLSGWVFAAWVSLSSGGWQRFIDGTPTGILLSIIVAIIAPIVLFIFMQVFFYMTWRIRNWRSVKNINPKIRFSVMAWLVGFGVWLSAVILDNTSTYSFTVLLGPLMIPLIVFGAFGLILLIADICGFKFIKQS